MEDLTPRITRALKKLYDEDPSRYTFVSSILSELGIPFDASIGNSLVAMQKQGLIEIMSTTNIRIRLTEKGAESLS